MFKQYNILIIAALLLSFAFAPASMARNANEIKQAGYTSEKNTVTASRQIISITTGVVNDLYQESLQHILGNVLEIKSGKIGSIIQKFESNTPNWLWIVQEGLLPENNNGTTQLSEAGVTTILDFDKLQQATNLSIARTIIHEMVHAYLTLYFRFESINANKDYPQILEAWIQSEEQDYNKIQHDEIERSFVNDIALALVEYAATAGLTDVDEQVYTDLAWGGLDFQHNSQLTGTERERIQNRLVAEQLNKRSGTANPAGFKIVD
jgi:hypothetical protein